MYSNEFIYGLCGGMVGTIVSHPFDTIKTRIQSNKANSIKNALLMKNLYSGLSAPLIGIMLEKSIVFGFFNKAKEYNLNNFWSGIVGGFMCTLIVTPIDRIKINLQNKEKLTNIKFNTLYRGFIPTVMRETPGFGIYFTTYNYLTTNYNKEMQMYKTFTFGSLSGLNAWLFIYPSDLVKTRIQSSDNNISIKNTIKNIYSENNKGIKNFYKGFSLAVMRAMPLHGGVFLGYELSKKYLN
jgi:solute carrier family 25 carnitine/acylcarnitine transporter 20/29